MRRVDRTRRHQGQDAPPFLRGCMAITELQRTKRQQTLGASDIATIFGANPWKTPADLWLEKTGRVEAPDVGEAAEIGDALEAGIRPLAERRLGARLVKPTGTFIHENGIMSANVDLMVGKAQRGSPIVEIKTTGKAEEWADGEIPARVLIQVCAQMCCSGSTAVHIAALLARFGLSLEMRHVEADQDTRDLMAIIEERAVDWWDRHVVADTPPEGVPTMEYLTKRVRQSGKVVSIPTDIVTRYQAAKAAEKQASDQAEEAKAALVAALADADAGETTNGITVKYTEVSSKRLDGDAIKKAHPDIAELFTKTSSYRRLTVKEPKL